MNSFFLHLTKFEHFQIRIGKEFWAKIEQTPVRLLKSPVYKSSVEEGEFFSEAVVWRCSVEKGVLEISSKFIEITLRHGCSPVNLQYISKQTFPYRTPPESCFCFFKLNNPLTFFLIFFSLILEVVMKKFKVKRQSCIYFAFTEAVFRRVL